jgi:hypothetical protein
VVIRRKRGAIRGLSGLSITSRRFRRRLVDMTTLLPEAIAQGQKDPLPTATEPPKPGSAGTEPLESDFQCKPGDPDPRPFHGSARRPSRLVPG